MQFDVIDLYRLLSQEDSYKFASTLYGHDVDMTVRNAKDIREMLNPKPILHCDIYMPNRISFIDIDFDVQAMGIRFGCRHPVESDKVFRTLHDTGREMTKRFEFGGHAHNNCLDGLTFDIEGMPFFFTHYEQEFNSNEIRMSARPTLQPSGK